MQGLEFRGWQRDLRGAKKKNDGQSLDNVILKTRQSYLKAVREGCQQLDIDVPRFIAKLQQLADDDQMRECIKTPREAKDVQ